MDLPETGFTRSGEMKSYHYIADPEKGWTAICVQSAGQDCSPTNWKASPDWFL
jgi:hypothetical protein